MQKIVLILDIKNIIKYVEEVGQSCSSRITLWVSANLLIIFLSTPHPFVCSVVNVSGAPAAFCRNCC